MRRLGAGERIGIPVRLVQRTALAPGDAREEGRYASLDEVFAFDHPGELMEEDGPGFALKSVTCWSDGRVNFKRAEPMVLREVLDGILTENQIYELERFRERSRDCTMGEALRPLELSSAQLEQVRKLLTDNSFCQSVWVVAKGLTRDWFSLYVARSTLEDRKVLRWRFEW